MIRLILYMPDILPTKQTLSLNEKLDEFFLSCNKKNFSCDNCVQNFLKFMQNNFSLDASFFYKEEKDSSQIFSLNIPKYAIEKNINVFRKVLDKKNSCLINKKIWTFKSSFFIPFEKNNIKFLFAFFSNSNQLEFYDIRNNIISITSKFLRFQISSNLNTNLLYENKILNFFINNFSNILPYTSCHSAVIKNLKNLIEKLQFLNAFFIYSLNEENEKYAKLMDFKSKEKVFIKGYYVKKENFDFILNEEKFIDCKMLLNTILAVDKNILEKNDALACLLKLNETESMVVLFLVNKDFSYLNSHNLLNKIKGFLKNIILMYDNKKQLVEYEKQKSISFFSSGILHYFNNFSQSAQTRLELLSLKSQGNEKILKDVNIIKNSFSETSNFFKNFSFLINNDILDCSNFSFADFIYEIYDNFKSEYGDIIDLEIDNLDVDYKIFASRKKLAQAIIEILQNSVDFSKEEYTNIKMTVKYFSQKNSKIRHFLRLYIDDIGSGISKENLPFIFEPFFSTKGLDKRTKISVNLSGIGLALARSVINSIGGFINVVSVEGKGTRVKIFIPISQE